MIPKYQYHVKTWGGFYNDEYKSVHGYEKGDFVFDTPSARLAFVNELKTAEGVLGAKSLCMDITEGFCCDIRTTLHRVIEFQGVYYYSTRDMGINYSFEAAEYHMENKWCPGFNDYPLGEDFDYSKANVVKEWITGAHVL